MASVSRISIILLALVLALPAASATWRAYGTYEPDTAFDDVHFMQTSPQTSGTPVYFNAFNRENAAVNPNSGTLGSRNDVTGERVVSAMLGQWIDCNEDGYVGVAEFALEEYPVQVLSTAEANSICPDGGAHNKGGWVTELLWIGYDYADSEGIKNSDDNPRAIMDPAVIVWGDEGLYSAPFIPGAGRCPTTPVPRGTFASVGGVLNDADCTDNYGLGHHWNNLMRGEGQVFGPVSVPALPSVNGATGQDLTLSDPTDWRTNPTVNQPTFGSEDASNSDLTWGCSPPVWAPVAPQLDDANQQSKDAGLVFFVNGGEDTDTGHGKFADSGPRAEAPGVSPSADPVHSVPGTLNATSDAQGGDCNTKDDSGHDFYGNFDEGDNAIEASRPHFAPDHQFNFTVSHRGELPGLSLPQAVQSQIPLSKDQPACLGVYLLTQEDCFQDSWSANDAFINPVVPRSQLITFDPVPHRRISSFYAHISSADGTTPGSEGRYGADQCPTMGAGTLPTNGWYCDPGQWYLNADGSVQTPVGPLPVLGTTYQLRDVDCDDGQIVAGLPVFVGGGTTGATCDDA